MSLRAAMLLSVVLASCTKAEPTKAESKTSNLAAPQAPKPKPNVAPRVPAAPGARPSLPATSTDFNPPGVPYLTGDVHEGEGGLQYIDEVVGTGRAPEKGKSATVHYTGWLTDGTKFDSSRDRDAPIAIPFATGSVIKGWDLGLETMRVGGKRRLLIPADIAYGAGGAGNAIPPDAVLVFDVELVDVDAK